MQTSAARSLPCAIDSMAPVSSPLRRPPQPPLQYPHLPSLASVSRETPYLGAVTTPNPRHRDATVDNSSFSVDNRGDLGITRPHKDPPCPRNEKSEQLNSHPPPATSPALPRYPQPAVDNISRLQPPQVRSPGHPPATSMGTQPRRTRLPHFPLSYYYDYNSEKQQQTIDSSIPRELPKEQWRKAQRVLRR
jgi:hypothetical protein